MSRPSKKSKSDDERLVCLCNAVTRGTVRAAIARGCDTLGKIFDATSAGVGACGGSCQPELRRLLREAQDAAAGRPPLKSSGSGNRK